MKNIILRSSLCLLMGCGVAANAGQQTQNSMREDNVKGLFAAAKESRVDVVKAYLNAGLDVNSEMGGETLLQMVLDEGDTDTSDAKKNHVALVELLLERGADANLKDLCGETPLINVLTSPVRDELVDLLLKYGADPNLKGNQYASPLHWAVRLAYTHGILKLIEHGADVNAAGFITRITPLHFAALDGQMDTVSLLLEAGACTHLRDVYERTPLHCAAFHGQMGTVRLLIKAGACTHLRDAYGKTPLHYAVEEAKNCPNRTVYAEIVDLLKK